jgi:hypothetical protein
VENGAPAANPSSSVDQLTGRSGPRAAYPASAEKRLLADTLTSTSTPEPLDIAVPVSFRTGTLRLNPKVICHDCHPGTPSSVRVTLVAGPAPMVP